MDMSVYGTFMDINAALATIDEEDETEESEVSSSIFFEDISPFCGATDTPSLVMSALGFKARVDFSLHCLHAMDSSGSTPADLLMASMAVEPFLIHILAHV